MLIRIALALLVAAIPATRARAQADSTSMPSQMQMPGMSGMDMRDSTTMPRHHHVHGTAMDEMDMSAMPMPGAYGPYPMTREASGTSWQPERTAHPGIHFMRGGWTGMLHGMADVAWDHQGGPRGDDRLFGSNMAMAMAQRTLGPATLGLRAMLSAEPATIGKEGYPLLLQTGETADGRTPLVDRQHPHDLLMELAASLAVTHGEGAMFVYGGLPGEPALGPPAFMHRFTAMNVPEVLITHHWLDSTHITYGVLTAGAVWGPAKIEASAFRGREPDENRWDIESPKLDSHAFRVSLNPGPAWALQASAGRLHSPEQLEPGIDQDRVTASAMRHGQLGDADWEALLAWGQDRNRPGHRLDAWLLEGSLELHDRHVIFVRGERVEKDELFQAPDPRAGQVFDVGKIAAGYRRDLQWFPHVVTGIGAMGTITLVPERLRDAYGDTPLSALVFLHFALR